MEGTARHGTPGVLGATVTPAAADVLGRRTLESFADPDDVAAHWELLAATGNGEQATGAFRTLASLVRDLQVQDRGRLGKRTSQNHARLVERDGERLVLKLTCEAFGNEIGALLAWQEAGLAGDVTPTVHEHGTIDPHGWVWSVQQLLPGSPPQPVRDLAAVVRADTLAQRLYRADVPDGTPSVGPILHERLERFNVIQPEHAGLISAVREALAGMPGPTGMVHGDFLAQNLLDDGSRLRAIDPFGLRAPAPYDLARFLARNDVLHPLAPHLPRLSDLTGHDLEQFAPLVAAAVADTVYAVNNREQPHGKVEQLVEDVTAILNLLG